MDGIEGDIDFLHGKIKSKHIPEELKDEFSERVSIIIESINNITEHDARVKAFEIMERKFYEL